MLRRRSLRITVPERDGPSGGGFEYDPADCVSDDFRDAASRSRGCAAQRLELFLAQV